MIPRHIIKHLKEIVLKYPIISITGPRQSGKTTLVKSVFPEYEYVSLENVDTRNFALEDPNRFLASFKKGVILDEIQKVPELFSYIQTLSDELGVMGKFIITGSQNFLLSESISQSLSGRVRILKLLPFSFFEINQQSKNSNQEINQILFDGLYPPVFDRELDPSIWFNDYIETYLERDVRNIKSISNLNTFQNFLRLCASRVGQLLNLNSLAIECGISHNTAKDWLSILEASYIVYRVNPYFNNFGKRIVKQSKLYFYDTGLICALLGIESVLQLSTHYIRGQIFETFIMTEYLKYRFNKGLGNNSFFWRDRYKNEVDILIQSGGDLVPIEIKSGATIHSDYFKGLLKWFDISETTNTGYLVYGGDQLQDRSIGKIFPWNKIDELFEEVNLNQP